ncbi:hypothetical protein EMCG_08828 [[Emmonsia] crescens]|uniref:Uncharacterized protein n=1 Tax=[Emmonsia] crescens TaxID=73230 RepID=A0A0G2I3U8_9EURO|nr:hypothetical protein EMCG_08828 [Emmonsia crescens UAMH 3008]
MPLNANANRKSGIRAATSCDSAAILPNVDPLQSGFELNLVSGHLGTTERSNRLFSHLRD